jgi:surface antigen
MGSLLKGTPEELFTEQDNTLRLEALGKAVEGAPPGEPVTWSNGATGHRGDVTMTRAFESRGRDCKELRLRNEAGSSNGESRVNACQVDGKWRLVGSSQLD